MLIIIKIEDENLHVSIKGVVESYDSDDFFFVVELADKLIKNNMR